MLLTRRADFSASHSCYNPRLSEEENRDLYGESAGSHGHGHNYTIEVTIEGQPHPVTGMVVDLKLLKDVIQREVLDPMDHRHLNHEVPPFSGDCADCRESGTRDLEPARTQPAVRKREFALYQAVRNRRFVRRLRRTEVMRVTRVTGFQLLIVCIRNK